MTRVWSEALEDPWAGSAYSSLATGDQGPWVRHLPLMWRALADPEGTHELPAPPVKRGHQDLLGVRIAWWSPLFHLMFYGLGWVQSDVAIERWIGAGRPTDGSPHLALLDRWWGGRIDDFLAFAAVGGEFLLVQRGLPASKVPVDDRPIRDRWEWRRAESTWLDEGPSEMHLQHVLNPTGLFEELNRDMGDLFLALSSDPREPRAVLRLNSYAGWYTALERVGGSLPARLDKRSWRVDVYLPELGFLGTYRQSRLTGRWFAGQHRWHELGIVAPGAAP